MNQFGIPYQLPPFYKKPIKKEEGKHRHQLFIFLKTTEAVIELVAAEAACCEKLELLELGFEKGITEAEIENYIDILKAALPAEREVEIASEANIPSSMLRERYQDAQDTAIRQEVASIRREALLN